jgi:hypothetical protein
MLSPLAIFSSRHSAAPRRGEPGIHFTTGDADEWIPGSRCARPGMTIGYDMNRINF